MSETPKNLFDKIEDSMSRNDWPHPGWIPRTPIIVPVDMHRSNQIQQTKGSAKPQNPQASGTPTTQPNSPAVQPRTTPGKVSNVRVIGRRTVNGQKPIVVQFNHPPGDQYFSGANVYLRKANGQPTLVASGTKSPLTFNAPVNAAPHSIFVTSVGNWGETNVLQSPSHPVRLA